MNIHQIFQSLKALASLVGVTATAIMGVVDAPVWLIVLAAGATAVASWSVPNMEIDPRTGKLTNVRNLEL